MSVCDSVTETLSFVNLRSKNEIARQTNNTYLNTSPDFQRPYEAWDDEMKTRLIETIILGIAMNPIWTVPNNDEQCEEVLDGQHRLKTAFCFFNNEFALKGKYLLSLDTDKYNGKKFKDLEFNDQQKIRNYSFSFNKLDSSYKEDKNKLQAQMFLLNHSSIPLNNYETRKVYLNGF